jgi:D-glycero-alpha-D-manno-heptose-7-phosphate kinase
MIIVQTPLRVSFFGGGTDFPDFFVQEGGAVLSTTIDKFIFVTIKPRFDRKLRVGWTRAEMVDSVDEIQHELIREAFRLTGINAGVEITTMADIPTAGSGLGSSSSVTVGALHAMYSLRGDLVTAERLACEACQIERDILGKPIGIQDQYAAALGGTRLLEFHSSGAVENKPLMLPVNLRRRLNENLLLFFTGITRQAEVVLTHQKANIQQRLPALREMRSMAYTGYELLAQQDLDGFGRLLHEAWLLKKSLATQISNSDIDEMYEAARQAGALGGKITGAGGGGFLLLYCPGDKQQAIRAALSHLQELPFKVEHDGSKVIFNYQRS